MTVNLRDHLRAYQRLIFVITPWHDNGLSFQMWIEEFGHRMGGLIFNVTDLEIIENKSLAGVGNTVADYFEEHHIHLLPEEVHSVGAALLARRTYAEQR